MIIETKCKLCGRPLKVPCEEGYDYKLDTLGLMRLVPLLACNRCADYAVERRRIFYPIKRLCEQLILRRWAKEQDEPKIAEALGELMRKYIRLMADYRGVTAPDWDESLLDAVVKSPRHFGDVLRRIPLMFRTQRELI